MESFIATKLSNLKRAPLSGNGKFSEYRVPANLSKLVCKQLSFENTVGNSKLPLVESEAHRRLFNKEKCTKN